MSHASLSFDERRRAEAAFAEEPDCVIVSTSTLELGIDVGDLDRVIQVGAPPGVASFLQRMGRTGRRSGTSRNCLFLATDDEELLICLALTSLWREGKVEPVVPPPRPAHLFAHSRLWCTFTSVGRCFATGNRLLAPVKVVHAVPKAVRSAIINHMLATGVLADDAGVVRLGARGEQEFGRRHFSDIVSAFSRTPPSLLCAMEQADLGTVHPASLVRRA